MLRLWLTSIGFGIVTAWYEGLDPLSPYLYEWIILGGIAFFGGGVLLAAAILRSGLLVLMALGAVPLAMGYAERLLAEGIKPRAAFHRYTEDPPWGWRPGSRAATCMGESRTGTRGIGCVWLWCPVDRSMRTAISASVCWRSLSGPEVGWRRGKCSGVTRQRKWPFVAARFGH